METPANRIADYRPLIIQMLRQLAVSLSVYDPDHPLHDEFMTVGERGSQLSTEGRLHLGEVAILAAESATQLAELEFSTVGEVPVECRDVLSAARECVSELSWLLWAIRVALESSEVVGEPPGRPGEILIRCATVAGKVHATSTSREGSTVLQVGKREE